MEGYREREIIKKNNLSLEFDRIVKMMRLIKNRLSL